MKFAEERVDNIAASREQASNTVHIARSGIEASRHRAEAEEREKHEAAYRLQEAEVEKRNLAAQLHQEQLRANQRVQEIENENRRLTEAANKAEAERRAVEEERQTAERLRREAEEAAASLWQEKLATQNEVLREKGNAQRIEEEAKLQADLGRTNQYAKTLEIEELKRALASAQLRVQQSEAMKSEVSTMAERLAVLEKAKQAGEQSHAPDRAPAGSANQRSGKASGGAVSPPSNPPSTILSPSRLVPEAPTPERQEWKPQPSFGAGNEEQYNMFTPDRKGTSASPAISPPLSIFAFSPHGTATPDRLQRPPLLPTFSGKLPDGDTRPAGGPEKIIPGVPKPQHQLVLCLNPKCGSVYHARLIQCPICGTARNLGTYSKFTRC